MEPIGPIELATGSSLRYDDPLEEIMLENTERAARMVTQAMGLDEPTVAQRYDDPVAHEVEKHLRDNGMIAGRNREHTPLPWNLHPAYDGKPFVVTAETPEDNPWCSATLIIARGTQIIAMVEMCTCETPGFPRVTNESEMRANADLILRTVNSHEALLTACRRADCIIDGTIWPEVSATIRAAIAQAKQPTPIHV
jgi:hypothetical protein